MAKHGFSDSSSTFYHSMGGGGRRGGEDVFSGKTRLFKDIIFFYILGKKCGKNFLWQTLICRGRKHAFFYRKGWIFFFISQLPNIKRSIPKH